MKYKCTITTGGGTEQDGGDFEIVETPKSITFNCVREPFFSAYNGMIEQRFFAEVGGVKVYKWKPVKINKTYSKKKVREDGNYNAWKVTDSSINYLNNGHFATDWCDGSWTVYPNQSGTPHYLERIP